MPLSQVQPVLLISPIKPLPKCACCSDTMPDEELIHSSNDGDICEDCRDNDYFYCEQCLEVYHNDNLICIEDEYFCSRQCANNAGFCKCADCSNWYDENNEGSSNSAGEGICDRCSENYCSCSECGDIYHNDDLHYSRSTGDNYCSDCWEGSIESIIKEYSYKPREYSYSKMDYENTVYLGIELEIECAGEPAGVAEKVKAWLDKNKVGDKVYFKEDSSIDNGFEIVFMPFTLKAIHKNFPMKRFLRYLQDLGCTSHEKGTCGLHVHISRKGLGGNGLGAGRMQENNIYKGKLFFYKCQSYLKKLSARVSKNSSSDAFNYCKFEKYMPSRGENEYGHFSAFNINASSKTVEIRIFRGTLIYERFLASLQFCDAFSEYIQIIGIASLKTVTREDVYGAKTWKGFITWVKLSGKYNQFYKYVIKEGII
jgi:hypothetical protein